jgi:hypothetical protein
MNPRRYLSKRKTVTSVKPVKRKASSKRTLICWKGYHRVKGTVAHSKHSCIKD